MNTCTFVYPNGTACLAPRLSRVHDPDDVRFGRHTFTLREPEVDWMKCDARTILDVMHQEGGWIRAEWPHETDALEKLERLLKALVGEEP